MARAINEQTGKPGKVRSGLMLYGSTAALAAALMLAEGGVGPAFAQDIGPRVVPTHAAQGDFVVSGATPTPFFEQRSDTLDIINMPRDAVLNWTTHDGAAPGGAQGNSYVNFLPEGAELRFVGNGQTFTAINRVFTASDNGGNYRGIAIQGQVTSYLFGDGPNSVGPVGGNIWFASPGGILVTGSASFNVGSLLLTASDLANFNEQGFSRTVEFTGVADPFASVILQTGSRVTLTQPGSSFAIVAPTIEQGGDVTVDGSVLYLSAEQGFLQFYNDGEILASTFQEAQAGNEIRHLGTTTGPASMTTDDFSVFDPHIIEFRTGQDVRVLLSGSIGYAPATDAALGPNGSIFLTAGAVSTAGQLTLAANTSIDAPQVSLSAGAGERIDMEGDVNGAYSLSVVSSDATLAAGAGGAIEIDGDVTFGAFTEPAVYRISAGAANGADPGGRISVGGSLSLDSTKVDFSGGERRGGDIEATIGDGGSIAVASGFTMRSDGYAADDVNDVTTALGGRAVLTMTGNASLFVGEVLTLSAQAQPFQGNCECSTPGSGSAVGGYAALTATGGSIDVSDLNVSASALAYEGNFAEPGAILDATGGTALVALGDSAANIGSISVTASARGARGVFGVDGGAAFGGTASFSKGAGGSLATEEIEVRAAAIGGDGGMPNGQGIPASDGGDATGGTVSLVLAQNAEGLDFLDVSASARGGAGGSAVEYSAESGGDGGNALGGDATVLIEGSGTNLAGVSEGGFDVSAEGGQGGAGEADFNDMLQSGDGGRGGAARGGTLSITSAGEADFQWVGFFGLNGTGGDGGQGGDAVPGDGGPGAQQGFGGVGGDGEGGEVSLTADGGTISGYLELDAGGIGGAGGLDGLDVNGNVTGSANFGAFIGGAITLETTDNGASRFDLDYATLEATGDRAGRITINHAATDPNAQMRFGSFFAAASGSSLTPEGLLAVSSQSGPITVDGTFEVYADSVALDFVGGGQLVVGGATFLTSDHGDITITHAANPGVLSVDSQGYLGIFANGDYDAGPGSVVSGGDEVYIRANGSLFAGDTRGGNVVQLSAQGDANVEDITSGGDIELYAGRYDFDGSIGYDPAARATFTGIITARGSLLVESGGFAEFASGSQVLIDNTIRVRTGDDIIVSNGASLASDIDPFLIDSLHLLAGDIDFGPDSGDLIGPITSPIASLVINGSLDTNGASLHLSGDAIDGSGSSITTGDFFADVTDAPPMSPFSNDLGLLSVGCEQGSICLGAVQATGDVAIGLDSNGGLVSLEIDTLDFDGGALDIRTRDRLEIGNESIASEINASNRVSLESLNSYVLLDNVAVNSPSIVIGAGDYLAAGNSALQSASDILLQIGTDITVGAIDTGGKLDDGSGSPTFAAPGNFTVGSLSYGGGNAIIIDAAGAIAVSFADPAGAAIDMTAGGDLYLGSTASDAGSIRLDGAAVSFDNLVSGGTVDLIARSGGIVSLSESSPVIDAVGGIALEASDAVSVGDLQTDGDIGISGASVTTASLLAGGDVAVTAQGAASVGSFGSGGSAVFTGASLDIGGGNAGSFLAAQATDGDLTFGALGAAEGGLLEASGVISGGDITVGGALSLLGGGLDIGGAEGGSGITASIGGDASFTALSSNAGSITVDAGGDIDGTIVDAAVDVGLSGANINVDDGSAGGNFVVDGVGLQATTLSAGGAMTLTLEGGAVIGTAAAGSDITIDAGILEATSLVADGTIAIDAGAGATIAEAVSGGSFSFTGSELIAGNLDAGATLDVAVVQSAAIDSLSSGGDAELSGRSLDLGAGDVGGSLSAQASEGDLSFVDLAVDGDAQLSASGSLLGGDIGAGGTLTLSGADMDVGSASGVAGVTATIFGDARFAGLASSGGSVLLDAGGAVEGGSANAAGGVTLTGASVALGSASFGDGLTLTAQAGDVTGSGLYQGSGPVSLLAEQGIAIGSVDTLGPITMTAGGEARFVELRSRDGSATVTAGGAIIGSSVAATGTDPEDDDNVALVAGGAISLDGESNSLNPVSAAQDDFTAQAGGTLAIVGAQAGRDLSFTAGAGTLSAADVVSGRDLSLSGPAVQLADGSVARNLTVTATAGDITGSGTSTAGGAVDLDASGNIAIGSLAANGGDLTATAGGGIGFTDLSASGALLLAAGDAITGSTLEATNGVTATGASLALGDVSAGEGAALLEATGGALSAESVSGSDVQATASGALTLGAVDASQSAILFGASIDFTSIAGGGSAVIRSDGAVAGGTVAVSNFASIYAADAITLIGLSAGVAVIESTGGPVSVTGIAVSEGLDVSGTAVSLAAPGALRVNAQATAGDLGVTAGGDLTVNGGATGDITLVSTGGSVIIGGVDQEIDGAGGGIGAQAVGGGGAVSVTAADAISIADSLTAGGALTMTAGGLVSLDGTASGQTIALRADDLAIGSGGLLGGANTQRIALASSRPVNLGAGASGGFAVDAAEFTRIRSGGDLLVTALPGEGDGLLTVGSLTVNAGSGGQIGSSGVFGLTSSGGIAVGSTLAIAGAGSGNTLMLTGDTVDLDYANAALSVMTASNVATGRIVVDGRLIASLSDSAAADIADATPEVITERLGQADVVREIELFRTADLTLQGRDAVLIQNSGGATADERRGLNVGALTVAGAQNGSTLLVINGVVGNETGVAAAENVTVNGALAAGSSVNGCVLANIAACFVIPEPEIPLILTPNSIRFGTGDLIKGDEDDEVEDGVADGKTDAPPIDTTQIDDPAGLPMIDDPVTGAGNEDLWQRPDE